MQVGWDGERRIRGNLVYITVNNGKVCFEYDSLENEIAQGLISAGIASVQITLAYLPEP